MANELEVSAREAFWRCHLERHREGGGSITSYCREHGLAESSFYAWRQRFERRDAAHDPDGSCGLPGRRQATALPSKSRAIRQDRPTQANHGVVRFAQTNSHCSWKESTSAA